MLLTVIISPNSINQLIFVMAKCCVFLVVRTEFLNTYYLDKLQPYVLDITYMFSCFYSYSTYTAYLRDNQTEGEHKITEVNPEK
jgi:hypothetical protein